MILSLPSSLPYDPLLSRKHVATVGAQSLVSASPGATAAQCALSYSLDDDSICCSPDRPGYDRPFNLTAFANLPVMASAAGEPLRRRVEACEGGCARPA